ncbi:hypothetical protein BWQ96_06655 [Gracilariopsis chorda]|uniref:Uncharacterized protein n=1 Tax=Gracilariopsis chorda TaxID=448386 RepID=A0A2V3INE1_9FLOR|nr:hypothetical protein BWQ96_06655 [Gracilariopsis chorda]|eukprot:PXF43598.1 hypothetical protein BWQ96_06655 [Gracilariopsis chorda]
MVTLEVDSRFINAGIYIIVDVIIFAVLLSGIISLQTWYVKHRMFQGHDVSVQEFPLIAFSGGVVSDGTPLSFVFVGAHLLLMAILFSLTLGVNGRSDKAYRPTKREYISRLTPSDTPLVAEQRIYPQILASCNSFEKSQLMYFEVAFDSEENRMELTDGTAENQIGNESVGMAVDSESVLCQDYEEAKPLLRVLKCGVNRNACCNLYITQPQVLVLERGDGGEQDWQRNGVAVWFGSTALLRNSVRSVSSQVSTARYNRLICLSSQTGSLPSGELGMRTNCMLGVWNENKSAFRFRLGTISLTNKTRNSIMDTAEDRKVEFTAYSVEIEIEWDANEEKVLSNGLHSIGGNMVPARLFLDTFVSRSSQSVALGNTAVYEKYEVLVTDISTACLVGYGVLTILGLIVGCLTLWMKCRKKSDTEAIPEVNTYQGLLLMLGKLLSQNQTDLGGPSRLAFRFDRGEAKQGNVEARHSSLVLVEQDEESNIRRRLQLAWATRFGRKFEGQQRGRSPCRELPSEYYP